jgi:hypothetical protein
MEIILMRLFQVVDELYTTLLSNMGQLPRNMIVAMGLTANNKLFIGFNAHLRESLHLLENAFESFVGAFGSVGVRVLEKHHDPRHPLFDEVVRMYHNDFDRQEQYPIGSCAEDEVLLAALLNNTEVLMMFSTVIHRPNPEQNRSGSWNLQAISTCTKCCQQMIPLPCPTNALIIRAQAEWRQQQSRQPRDQGHQRRVPGFVRLLNGLNLNTNRHRNWINSMNEFVGAMISSPLFVNVFDLLQAAVRAGGRPTIYRIQHHPSPIQVNGVERERRCNPCQSPRARPSQRPEWRPPHPQRGPVEPSVEHNRPLNNDHRAELNDNENEDAANNDENSDVNRHRRE